MSPRARRRLEWSVAVAAVLVGAAAFVAITAAQGSSTISIPVPSLGELLGASALGLFGFFGRRAIRKLDAIGDKCDDTHEEFGKFRTEMRTVLLDVDGRGGLVNDVRDLQAAVFRDNPPIAPPPGFSIAPRSAAGRAEP